MSGSNSASTALKISSGSRCGAVITYSNVPLRDLVLNAYKTHLHVQSPAIHGVLKLLSWKPDDCRMDDTLSCNEDSVLI